MIKILATCFLATLLLFSENTLAAEGAGAFGLNALELRFAEALILIALACLCVPLSRKLGLGTIIGYLLAGVLAGAALSLPMTEKPEDLLHFAEFGVVLLSWRSSPCPWHCPHKSLTYHFTHSTGYH